jgi:hypothetical protein
MLPDDLQARIFPRNSFWFADREAGQRLIKISGEQGPFPYCNSGALVAHGLLRNHKETEVSHSPTVSRPCGADLVFAEGAKSVMFCSRARSD